MVRLDGLWYCPTRACADRQLAWALARQVPKVEGGQFVGFEWERWWVPLPKQVAFLELQAPRKLLGGAAGPGKSDVARKGAYRLCLMVPGLSVLLLRKTNTELERTHIRAMRAEQGDLGFKLMEQAGECRFPNGSVIECGYMDDATSVQKYLSSEYDLIIPEEAVQYDPDHLMELMTRARSSKERVKALGGPWVWLPTNPGGPSHHLLKALFMDHQPDTEAYPALARDYRPAEWQYIHATLDDNPYLDPDYERLSLSGLRRARYAQLRHGDWDAAEGQFFDMFSAQTHTRVVAPPEGAQWVEAFDWGYTQPSCWAAFVHLGDNHWHVQQCLKWTKLEPADGAARILEARAELGYSQPSYAVADPKIFSEDRGESIAETFARHGVRFVRATNRRSDSERQMGWPRLAAWFRFDPATEVLNDRGEVMGGVPWLTFDPHHAAYLVRSIPALLADPHNPEDVDSSLDDHGADMCRYFTMSRPPLARVPRPVAAAVPVGSLAWFRQQQQVTPGVLG